MAFVFLFRGWTGRPARASSAQSKRSVSARLAYYPSTNSCAPSRLGAASVDCFTYPKIWPTLKKKQKCSLAHLPTCLPASKGEAKPIKVQNSEEVGFI
ncbi:Uncharacterized protein TCM_037595 [Theobroma cacao]|uniref:Uncharacterized protein n=1 Tax=Theobroma cacao TaxID=3641 RepID=A0A061GLD6_THECC|nr:Uncharacterized protein TCM_037595 [Theobroma cacao]